MYNATQIGENLYSCNECGGKIDSGFMNFYNHSLICRKYKTWPIDPNAPKISKYRLTDVLNNKNKNHDLILVGGNHLNSIAVELAKYNEFNGVKICQTESLDELMLENGIRSDFNFKITAPPIIPELTLKDDFVYSGKSARNMRREKSRKTKKRRK